MTPLLIISTISRHHDAEGRYSGIVQPVDRKRGIKEPHLEVVLGPGAQPQLRSKLAQVHKRAD